MGTTLGGIHTFNLKISLTQTLQKRTKGPVMVEKQGFIALHSDTERIRGDFGVLSGELKTEPSTGKDR